MVKISIYWGKMAIGQSLFHWLEKQTKNTLSVSMFACSRPGFQARSKDLRGGRWSCTLKLAQKRSWWSWAEKVGLPLLWVVQVVHQQQCNGHCLSDSAQAQQLKQRLCSAQVAGQWRGDTALTLPLFWWRSTVSFRQFPWSSLHSFIPFPLCPRP